MTHTPATTVAAVAAKVAAAIRDAGLTEAEASRRAGIPQSTLNRKLKGLLPGFTMAELSFLAAALPPDADGKPVGVSDLMPGHEVAA